MGLAQLRDSPLNCRMERCEVEKSFVHLCAPRKVEKVFARLFQKAAGYKGSALGRAPQSAESPIGVSF